MTTWTTLTANKATEGSIRNWVNHENVPATTIVPEAETLIFQRLRVIEMQKLLTGSLAVNDSTIDISALRFLSPRAFFFIGDRKQQVTFRNLEMFEITRAWDNQNPPQLQPGTPQNYTHDRQTIYFDYKADAITHYNLWYFQRPEPLSASVDSNFLSTDLPHILIAACLHRAYKFLKDSRRARDNLEELAAYIDAAHVQSDMAYETAEYNSYWNQDGGHGYSSFD